MTEPILTSEHADVLLTIKQILKKVYIKAHLAVQSKSPAKPVILENAQKHTIYNLKLAQIAITNLLNELEKPPVDRNQ